MALVGVADEFKYDAKALHVSEDSGDGFSLWVGGAVDVSKVERADVIDFGEVALSYPSQAEYAYGQGLVAFESAFEELEEPSVSEANPAGADAWPPSAFEEGVCGPFRYRGDLSGGRHVALRVPAAAAGRWVDAAGRDGAFGSVVVRVMATAGVPEETSAVMTADPPASYEYSTDETPYNRAFKDAGAVAVRDLVQPEGTVLITLSEGADTFWVSGKPFWPATAR